MRRPWLFMAALSIPVAIVLIGFGLDRDERGDTALSQTAPSETSVKADLSRDGSEQARGHSPGQDGAERTTQGQREPDVGESSSLVQPMNRGQRRGDPESTSRPRVPAAQLPQAMDVAVGGRSFPVSDSVVEACKPAKPGVFRWEACDRTNELLIEMAKEPRDEVWAAATEKLLRAYAEQEPGKFTIRALECRQTVCFIETASIFGGLPDAGYRFFIDHGLTRGYSVEAFETDDAGARLTITLFPFTRR